MAEPSAVCDLPKSGSAHGRRAVLDLRHGQGVFFTRVLLRNLKLPYDGCIVK